MFTRDDLARLQAEQFRHDQRNHSDIISLPKADRLKHYGLHFAKYVGRLARYDESKPLQRTLVDTVLVCLSAANTLHQKLADHSVWTSLPAQVDLMRPFADAAGRFADACEKIDHMEDFLDIAKRANLDVLQWAVATAKEQEVELKDLIRVRRQELADRQFFVKD